MSDDGIVTEPGTVRFERLLPGPIERVWAFLTESDKRAKWLAAGEMELRVGGKVELTWRNSQLAPPSETTPEKFKQYEGMTATERITRCEPPRVLAFTWSEGDDESEVSFELTPVGEKVLLVLTHRRLRDKAAMVNVSGGWHAHLGVLADVLADRAPTAFWSVVERMQAEYEARIPAPEGRR
jgi:uncharacterized protein YndB with AHSA1/START domain